MPKALPWVLVAVMAGILVGLFLRPAPEMAPPQVPVEPVAVVEPPVAVAETAPTAAEPVVDPDVAGQLAALAITPSPEPTPTPAATAAPTLLAPEPSTPAPPSESELRRERGKAEYDTAMARVAAKASQMDIAWARWVQACQGKSRYSVSQTYSRGWYALGESWSSNESTVECQSNLSDARELYRQITNDIDRAYDTARMAGVLPGDMRAIRDKHGLDWSGWDR